MNICKRKLVVNVIIMTIIYSYYLSLNKNTSCYESSIKLKKGKNNNRLTATLLLTKKQSFFYLYKLLQINGNIVKQTQISY